MSKSFRSNYDGLSDDDGNHNRRNRHFIKQILNNVEEDDFETLYQDSKLKHNKDDKVIKQVRKDNGKRSFIEDEPNV
jgi:hypothetical protein